MTWLTLLRKFWPYIAGALLLIAVYIWFQARLRNEYRAGHKAATAEMQAELDSARQLWRQIDEETEREHATQLQKLRSDAARELRGRPIRCVLGSTGQVRDAKDSGEPVAGAAGESALRNAPDIRSSIVRQGEQCEGLRQQLIAIKSWQDSLR